MHFKVTYYFIVSSNCFVNHKKCPSLNRITPAQDKSDNNNQLTDVYVYCYSRVAIFNYTKSNCTSINNTKGNSLK